MSALTDEQRAKIEENRRKALQRRAERSKTASASATVPSSFQVKKPITCQVPLKSVGKSIHSSSGTSQSFMATGAGTSKPFTSGTASQAAQAKAVPPVNKAAFYAQKKQVLTGSFRLLSAERFAVDVGYNQEMIERFKQVPGRSYHPEEKMWSFAVAQHDQVAALLRELPGVTVAALPGYVLRCLRQTTPAADNISLSALDPALLDALMPFQREGIRHGVARGGRLLLADDMGLGKTIQALGIMSYFHDWPLLVACPSSMRYQWRQEILRFLPSQHPDTVSVMDSSKDFDADARILIVSYDLLSRCAAQLRDARFCSVIMDESHCLKNQKAARTRAAIPLLRAARRVLLLSGTPALSRPIELYTQIGAVERGLFPSYQDFGVRYCDGHRTAWGWDFSGSSRMTELQILLERRVMLRRLKRDVIEQLPAKRRQLVVLDPSQVKARTKKMDEMMRKMGEKSLKGMKKRGALLEYFNESATAKLPAVLSYLEDLLDAGAKFLCFAHHQVVMDAVCEMLERRKDGFIRIDGATSSAARKRECDRFQGSDRVRVAVLSITAANAGLTLTAAGLVVFAELFWNPGVLTQAEDRAHRIGQQDSVQVRYLVARGTADDHIWPLVQSKLDVLNKAGLSKDDFTEADQDRQKTREDQRKISDMFSEMCEEFEDLPEEVLSGEVREEGEGGGEEVGRRGREKATVEETGLGEGDEREEGEKEAGEEERVGDEEEREEEEREKGDEEDEEWVDGGQDSEEDEEWGEDEELFDDEDYEEGPPVKKSRRRRR